MAALTATTPARTGTVTAGTAVAASDTIAVALLGVNGAYLEIANGNAAPDVMAISDASVTPSGATAAANAPTVTNATSKVFWVSPKQADPVTGLVTITHSVTTTVTYKLYPIG